MNKRLFFVLFLSPFCAVCSAQATAVVYDIETKMPVSGVTVFINPKGTTTTDKYGRFFLQTRAHSVTLTHVGYEKRVLYGSEVRDTIFLLPKLNVIDDVVIVAKKPKVTFDMNKISRDASYYAPPQTGIGFDFFSIFSKKKKSGKEREKFNNLMRNYSK